MAVLDSSGVIARPGKMQGWLRVISLITVLATFALVVMGGVVRVTGSGLGCPDWPLCYGSVFPPLQLQAIIEYTHRLLASAVVGPLILVTCALVWIAFRQERWLLAAATVSVALLAGQAVLGGITVLNELPGGIVAAHLALGEALLACLALVAVAAYRGPPSFPAKPGPGRENDRFPALAVISAIGVYLLLLSGSLVTATGALAVCLDWPLCQGAGIPAGRLPMIHMGHRFAAAIIGILLLYTLHLGFRDRSRPVEVRVFSLAAAALFLGQVVVGAATVWLRFPAPLMALHLSMATAVWGITVAVAALGLTSRSIPVIPSEEPVHA